MYLGIEIGGTKLQVGVGRGDGASPVALERHTVVPESGASGILEQIRQSAERLLQRHPIRGVGIGFGGPVDCEKGRVLTSHQIDGWERFPLVEWCRDELHLPAALANDADLAGLAEATFGAGQGSNPVFYVTVGSGIGGGLIVDGRPYRGHGSAAAEIGQLRPGLDAAEPNQTVESRASGWAIATAARHMVNETIERASKSEKAGASPNNDSTAAAQELLRRVNGRLDDLTTKLVAEAASEGNAIAIEVMHGAFRALGWGIAQTITLVAPEIVVIGGGVSLAGEAMFFEPVRAAVQRYVFAPLADRCRIVPAALGEEMVVHGALLLARQQFE